MKGFWVKACVHLDQGYLLMNECTSVFSDFLKKPVLITYLAHLSWLAIHWELLISD